MLWVFEKDSFQILPNCWVTKLQPFAEKVSKSVQNYWNQSLIIGRLLENGFEATLRSKRNVVSIWKGQFSVFSKVFSDKIQSIFCVSELKRSKPFKSKCGQRKLHRNRFWSYFELKNECSKHLKKSFFGFLLILSDEVEVIFSKSEGKHLKLFESKFGHRKVFIKLFSSYLQLKNECCVCLETAFFSFLQISEWQSWNHFLGKWGKAVKTI